VSDHLAFVSKYDSEEWTSALRCFDGWTDHTPDVEESVRTLVLQHKLQGVNEMSDLESSLLRSQISDAMLRATTSEKEKVAAQDAHSQAEAPATKRQPTNDAKNGNVSYTANHCGFVLYSFRFVLSQCFRRSYLSCP
jgi:hypothetical protein